MLSIFSIARNVGIACLVGVQCFAGAVESSTADWPSTVVRLEDLRPLTPFSLRVPSIVVKGKVEGPSILRVRINVEGDVTQTTLLESCGNSDLDIASMNGMRDMRFKPYISGGAPKDVTLVVPIHVPKQHGRSR